MITIFFQNAGFDITQSHFPDNTLHATTGFSDFPTHIDTIEWKYENDAELFTLICLRKKYASDDIQLNLPYIPHARMDRVKDNNDVFTLKYFAEIINSLDFTCVKVFDPHSNVSLALIDRIYPEYPKRQVFDATHDIAFKETGETGHEYYEDTMNNLLFFYPDEGAMKRYSEFFTNEYAFGIKKRDWKTGKIQGLDIMNKESVAGKNILIIDDICSRGGTFYHSAKALKEAGAKNIYLYISHCEESIFLGDMYASNLIDHIYVGNPLFDWKTHHDKITII